MEFITDLWIPILVGTVALQFASTMAWMVLPHHFNDHSTVPGEDDLMDWVTDLKIPAGSYMFPYPETAAEMSSKEHQERYAKGPRGTLHVYRPVSMPVNILKTLLYFFCTVGTIGYITHVAHACRLPAGCGVDGLHAGASYRGNDWNPNLCQQWRTG